MFVGCNTYNVVSNLRLNGDLIKVVNNSKDLGIIVDSGLKFQTHINVIVVKVHARANLIRRCFISKDTCTLVKAFRPLLEYCPSVWSPYLYRLPTNTSNQSIADSL